MNSIDSLSFIFKKKRINFDLLMDLTNSLSFLNELIDGKQLILIFNEFDWFVKFYVEKKELILIF